MFNGTWTRPSAPALLLIGATLILPGCVTTTGGAGTEVFCRTQAPICWSVKDSDETIRQAKRINAIGKEVCGWMPKTHPCVKR